ncbi:MAG: MATE family efflux transporter [Firmicutes bacterium]|nr:MATE family efflux transporter [Bacillota bacterium]
MKAKGSSKLTEGNIYSCIIAFALPILASHIFQNLYNSVDSIVVGNYVGKTALAAVGSCSDISALLTGFFTGLSNGAGVLFARYYGSKDYRNLQDSIHTAVTFSLIIGVLMAAVGVLLTPFLLRLVDCPADVYPEAVAYLRVYFIGVLFTAIYNVGSGVLRAVGDSLRPFLFLVVASVINIGMDLFTVVVLHMGVVGVALATIVSQLISVILVFGVMMRTDDVYKLSVSKLHINGAILKEVIRLGIPAAIQSSLLSLSNLFVQKYLNSFGSSAMAGSAAAKKVDKFIGMIGQSIGQATAPYVSQNIGAGKKARVKNGIKAVLVISNCTLVAVTVLILFASRDLIGIFTSDGEALGYGMLMLQMLVPFYVFQNLNQIFSNTVRGFGHSSMVMILSLSGMIGCRQLFLAITMSIAHDIRFVFLGFPVGWFCSGLFVYIYYAINKKKLYAEAFGEEQ